MSAWLEQLRSYLETQEVPPETLQMVQEAIWQRDRLLAGINTLYVTIQNMQRERAMILERWDALAEQNAVLRQQIDEMEK